MHNVYDAIKHTQHSLCDRLLSESWYRPPVWVIIRPIRPMQ